MLGENKNQYYLVDKEKFKVNFLKIFKEESKLNTNNKLYENILKLLQAYALACGEDISKKKIMVIHSHLFNWTKYISEKNVAPVQGGNIVLTIDSRLQQFVEDSISNLKGAIIKTYNSYLKEIK